MIIGIGGPSNSGKSRLAAQLKKYLAHKKVIILSQDHFVFPEKKIPLIRDHVDWEIPESINFKKLYSTIVQEAKRNDVLIAEGFLMFYDTRINALLDKKIFITISRKELLRRKVKDLRWGREPQWYIEHIWSSYEKYGRINATNGFLMLDGEKDISIPDILNFLNN